MLKRKALRKICITTFSILTIFIICIMPDKLNSNNNYLNPKIDTIYVDNSKTNSIYLLGDNGYLVKTNIIVNKKELKDKIKEIIDYLTVNKNSKIPNGFKGIIPNDAKLNNIELNDKMVILDFSKELLNTKLKERMRESIVYSLIELDGIEGVTIKVDGNILEGLPEVLNRTYGINKVYEIDDYKNVEKVVLYYLDIINDKNYYVPVTKYLNDDRDKIQIIIDNLSSSYVYESSLMSLLKSNIELINNEIEDKMMKLNFNNDIFSDDKVLEEVTYSISESVFENYDVDSVLFQVNGKDIVTYEKCCGIKK